MASGQGTATLDFGAYPGANEASIAVTGQTTVSATSKGEAFVMADATSTSHTANDHKYLPALMGMTCGAFVAGTGFTIYARSTQKLQGTWTVNFVWAD